MRNTGNLVIEAVFADCADLKAWREWKLPMPGLAAFGRSRELSERPVNEMAQARVIDALEQRAKKEFQSEVVDKLLADQVRKGGAVREAHSLGVVARDDRAILFGLLISVDAQGRTLPVGTVIGLTFVEQKPLFSIFFRPLIDGSGSAEFDRLVQAARQDQRLRTARPS